MRILKWIAGVILVIVLLAVVAVFVAYWRSDDDCARRSAPTTPIKAIVHCDFGDADVLKLEDIEKPVPNDDQVLIRVQAASINPYDWHFMRGTPYIVRTQAGLRKPNNKRIGGDVAGQVEAVGKNVTRFKAGDEVFGLCGGSLAEYCLGRSKLALKPAGVSFEQAAAVPIAGMTALQGLRDQGKVQPGQKVLINGASGGVGTFAVQIAKSLGANVTGVCSTRNVEMVRSLGADRVIDYTKEDFTKGDQRYDVILDCVGTQPLAGFRRVLVPKGILVMIGGGGPNEGNWIGPMGRAVQALVESHFVKQKAGMMMADVNKDDLTTVADMIQNGKIKPVIDRHYKLDDVPQAMRYLEEGHARGKVIIDIGSPGSSG